MSAETNEQGQSGSNAILLVVSWLWVGVPLLYGVYELMTKTTALFVHH